MSNKQPGLEFKKSIAPIVDKTVIRSGGNNNTYSLVLEDMLTGTRVHMKDFNWGYFPTNFYKVFLSPPVVLLSSLFGFKGFIPFILMKRA